MRLTPEKKLHLVSGRANAPLADEIATSLEIALGEAHVAEFANGEIHCRFGESVRGSDVFIIQSHSMFEESSLNDSVMEQLIMVDAAKRASARKITVVCPFYAYARQDRKAEGREPITAKLLANMFEVAGATRMVTVDLHSQQIQGFFDIPVDHLTAMPVLVEHLSTLGDDLVVVSPDAGRVKVAERYSNMLGADLAIVHKRRLKGLKNAVEAKDVVGEVAGRTCVVIDDMIDTAGTICAAAELLVEKGASDVIVGCTHAVFSGPAVDRLKNAPISRVFVTNTLPLPPEKMFDKVEVLSIAPGIADAMEAVFGESAVSEIFGGANQS